MSDLAILNRPSTERRLRDRIEELEEELRQAKELSKPVETLPLEWKLEPSQRKLVLALFKARGGFLSHEQLFHLLNVRSVESSGAAVVAQQVLRARRNLKPFGIEILSHYRLGYEIPAEGRSVIRDAIERMASI